MSIRLKSFAPVAFAGTLCTLAASANAATFVFAPGASSPSAGYTVVNMFDDATGLSGSNYEIKTPPADGDGAPPASSSPPGTSYLSVLADGSATYLFGPSVTGFQFDWGSVDSYNTLTVETSAGTFSVLGSAYIPSDGNQSSPATNGLLTALGAAGETFTSVTWSSSENSFEVDNLAIAAVPEPGTWVMMFIGFGMIGATARYRRRHSLITYA